MGMSGHVNPARHRGEPESCSFIPAPSSSLVLEYRAGDRMFMLGINKGFQTLPKPGAFSLKAAAGASLCRVPPKTHLVLLQLLFTAC